MDSFQSGKTQAIDLDELGLDIDDLPGRARSAAKKEKEMDKWSEDPWAQPTVEEKKKRRWAEDMKWSGDGQEEPTDTAQKWDENPRVNEGWNAPKRGNVATATEWDDWNESDGEPMRLEENEEIKEDGGRRKFQAAAAYETQDSANYDAGHAKRNDVYQTKEAYGTAGIRERKGDPYANASRQSDAPLPEMKPVNEWDVNDIPSQSSNESGKDMNEAAPISNPTQSADDIPGMTRASIILFQPDAAPFVYELKKKSTTIGRGLDNMVILNDMFASRHHLVIKYVNGLFEAFGLSEDNVACCNKYPFCHIRLMNGDQIELGMTRVKFVVGPVNDGHMKLKAPKNGRPMHLSEPPVYIRSAREMRKNLIILASAVAAILLIVILSLVGAASSQRAAEEAVQAKIQAEKDRIAAEEEAARQAEEAARVTLDDDELSVVAGMFEAYRAVVQDAESSSARIAGDNVKIKVESTPSGARIYNADGSFRGVTPYEITERMDGSREEKWTFRLEGYEDQKVDVRIAKSMNPVIVTLEKGGSAAVVAPDPEPAPKPAAKPATKSSSKSSAKSSGKSSGGKKKPGGKRLLL